MELKDIRVGMKVRVARLITPDSNPVEDEGTHLQFGLGEVFEVTFIDKDIDGIFGGYGIELSNFYGYRPDELELVEE